MLWTLVALLLQDAVPAVPGLLSPVKLAIEPGPLLPALASAERQTGLAFAVLPELLPADLRAPAFTFEGPAKEGLDRLAAALDLTWQLGELGGIVLLPKTAAHRTFTDWVEATFGEERGVEILELGETGQRLGLRKGDVLVALDGERKSNAAEFFRACRELPENAEATFTVRREGRTFQIRTRLVDRGRWASIGLGAVRIDDAPAPWAVYQKAGHRGPAWDGLVRRLLDEIMLPPGRKDPEKILALAVEGARAGCRDPYLLDLVAGNVMRFDAAAWEGLRPWIDPGRLRNDYGGGTVYSRARLCSRFVTQGPVSIRSECRRFVEAAWASLRNGPETRQRRLFAHALATDHFLEGRYAECARLMKSIEAHYQRDMDVFEVKVQLQALCRLGRFDEAIEQHRAYLAGGADAFQVRYGRLLEETKDALSRRFGAPAEQLSGPRGVVAWKVFSALDALGDAAAGKPLIGRRALGDMEGEYGYADLLSPVPFHDDAEIRLFPRAVKAYTAGASKVGLVLGAQPKPGNADPSLPSLDVYQGCQYMVTSRLHLWRRFGPGVPSVPIPLQGFRNDGSDELRLLKAGDTLGVFANEAWITTDVVPNLRLPGTACLHLESIAGWVDAGVLIGTPRCYDNDRIRDLMERVIDAREKIGPEERLKLWDEASLLAPPSNMMKELRRRTPESLRKRVPAPAYPEDAPPLEALTVDQAVERFRKRGALRWAVQDPADVDTVWCARPDGTVERMSRAGYWTTVSSSIRDAVGKDVAVGKPLFLKDAVWFPTDRGLFRHDRKGGIFGRTALGGIFHDVAVISLSMKDVDVRVETPGSVWRMDPKGGWRRE